MLPALLAAIVPTFGLLAIGVLWRRLDAKSGNAVHALNRYAFVVALPALIFDAVFALQRNSGLVLAPADVRFLLGIVIGHAVAAGVGVVLRLTVRRRDVRALAPMLLTFGSTAYFGIPFVTYAFGPTGTAYAAIGSVVLVTLALAAGLAALNSHASRAQRNATWHELLELPFLWVVLLALALPIIGVRELPEPISRAISALGASAAPVALIALGAFAHDLRLGQVPWRWAAPLGIGKVVLPAAASFIALSLLGVTGIPLAVGAALGAAPLAITAFTLAEEYNTGEPLVAGAMAASLVASILALTAIAAVSISSSLS